MYREVRTKQDETIFEMIYRERWQKKGWQLLKTEKKINRYIIGEDIGVFALIKYDNEAIYEDIFPFFKNSILSISP